MPLSAVVGAEVIHTNGHSDRVGRCVDVNASTTMLDPFGCPIAWATPGRLRHQRTLPVCEGHPSWPPPMADSRDHAPRSVAMHLLVAFGTERTGPTRTISSSPRDSVSGSTCGGNRRVVVNRSTISSGIPSRRLPNQLKRSPHSSAAGTVRHGRPGDIRTCRVWAAG